MLTEELREYVQKAKENGLSLDALRKELRESGWAEEDITDVLREEVNRKKLESGMDLTQRAFEMMRTKWRAVVGVLFFPTLLLSLYAYSLEINTVELQRPTSIAELQTYIVQRSEQMLDPFYLLIIPLSCVLLLANIAVLLIYKRDELKSWQDAYGASYEYFGRYFWMNIVSAVITVWGYLMLVVPGLIFGVWFGMMLPVLIVEKRGVFGSLVRSRSLVKGNFWVVVWRYLLYAGVITILSIPFGILAVTPEMGVVAAVGSSIVTQMFAMAFLLVLYDGLIKLQSLKVDETYVRDVKVLKILFGISATILSILLMTVGVIGADFLGKLRHAELRGEDAFEWMPVEVREELEAELRKAE